MSRVFTTSNRTPFDKARAQALPKSDTKSARMPCWIQMSSPPCDYLSPDISSSARPSRCWPWKTLTIIIAAPLLAVAAWSLTFRQVETRMDAITGSITSKTVWPFGITSGPRTEISPLETRLRASGIAWTPSWQFLHNIHHNLFGDVTCHECGTAPAIYQLRPVLQQFAEASTQTQLREFVRIMQSGTNAQRQATVQAAAEIGFAAISPAHAAPSSRRSPNAPDGVHGN